jgi:hypothetical protein
MTAPAFGADAPVVRRALPRRRDVLREQLRATGLALRGPALAAGALVAVITLVLVVEIASDGAMVHYDPRPTMLPGLVGALLPIAVWAREERFGTGFLWTLPVDRRAHALARVLAGWTWLMAAVALFVLWLLALTVGSGGRVLPEETLQLLTAPLPASGPLDPASVRAVRWAPHPLLIAAPFTAATASYLLASALALGSRHPLRWVIGGVLAFLLAAVMGQVASTALRASWLADAPWRALRPITEGAYGLDALLTARTESLDTAVPLATGETLVVWTAVPQLAHWLTATLLWTALALLALWAAASRHRERRRR